MKYAIISDGSVATTLGSQSVSAGVNAITSILQGTATDTATAFATVHLGTETGSTANGNVFVAPLNTRSPGTVSTPVAQSAGTTVIAWRLLSIAGIEAWRGDYKRTYIRQNTEGWALQNSVGSNYRSILFNEDWPGNEVTRSTRRGREPGFWMLGTDCITYHQKTGGGAYQTPFINRQINDGLYWQDPPYRYRGVVPTDYRGLPLFSNNPPTVVLNTADGNDFGTNTTPTLEFTGTDVESEDITYEIQIATDTNFGSVVADSNAIGGSNGFVYSGSPGISQAFTGVAGKIGSVTFLLSKFGSPTGGAVAALYAISGTYGSTAIPGTFLAYSDNLDVSTLSTTATLVTLTFSGSAQYQMVAGTKYVISFEYSGGDGSNFVQADFSVSDVHSGNLANQAPGGAWTSNSVNDLRFSVSTVNSIALDKFSATDAGFLNTVSGGDLDPFTQNNKISYTLQSSIGTGTRYWRVQGKDPAGSGSWGGWSPIQSYIVSGVAAAVLPDLVIQPLLSPPKFK